MSAKPKRKYSQATRLHEVVRLIEGRRGITLDELAEETGVDRRTVHRDLAVIEESGYPLVSEWQGRHKVYYFITGFRKIPPISFSLQELMTLALFHSQLDFLQGTPFYEDMEAITCKVNSVLPPRYTAHLERISQVTLPLLSGRRDYSRSGAALRALREAMLYQYRTILSYAARGRELPEAYEVDPYTIVFHKGGIYLLGYAHNRQALRTFAVERIVAVEVRKERFDIPEDFNAGERFRTAFGIVDEPVMPVRIRFAAGITPAIRERIWHESQRITDEPDGTIILSFEAGGRMEIVSWILSWGQHAEVLAPESLRNEVAGIVADLANIYVNSSKPPSESAY